MDTEPSQPTPEECPAQEPPAEQVDARAPQATRSRSEITWTILLVVALGLASGALGALLFSIWLPQPAPQVKIGMISLTRLTRAVADAEPQSSAGFAPRFDAAVKRLVEAEPSLVLFVKEAVIDTGQVADYTDALMPLFAHKASPSDDHTPRAAQPGD